MNGTRWVMTAISIAPVVADMKVPAHAPEFGTYSYGDWAFGDYSYGDWTFGSYAFGDYTFAELSTVAWGEWYAEQGENPDDCMRSQNADHITQISNVITEGVVTDGDITDGAVNEGETSDVLVRAWAEYFRPPEE